MKIFSQTHDQFVQAVREKYGKGSFYATPIYRQVMQTGNTRIGDLDRFKGMPALADRLQADLELTTGQVVEHHTDGGVVKFVTRLQDGLDIESVVIPMYRRHTLCVSSQVGCRMGCRFCRTGKMGLVRSLSAAEIVGQVFTARHHLGFDIRNVVFMGMGEPLDNFDNVVQAITVLSDQRGFDIARRYITVSTVGLADAIDRLAVSGAAPVNLAISLNAPNDSIRSALMPVNRAIPMDRLKASLLRYPLGKKGSIFVEYVLIEGVNDHRDHAAMLARFLRPLTAKLNLIPYNPADGSRLEPPSAKTYHRFHGWLVAEGVFVRRRGEKGGRIMAACGQLGGPRQNRDTSALCP